MAYRPSEGRNQKKQTPPEQPNLVPLMNLFITIVPFLLTIVIISQVAMIALNFSAPASGGSGGSNGGVGGSGPEVKVIIMASEGNQLYPGFEIRGWGGKTISIRNKGDLGTYDFVTLNNTLAEIRKSFSSDQISVVVYPDVMYGTLIQTIDLCKQNGFPNVIYKPASVSYGTGG
jgi:biopolymer transport protein ExbD